MSSDKQPVTPAIRVLREHGCPSFVSFDFILNSTQPGAPTGADCAAALCSMFDDKEFPATFDYAVHSTFEGAKEDIDRVMRRYGPKS